MNLFSLWSDVRPDRRPGDDLFLSLVSLAQPVAPRLVLAFRRRGKIPVSESTAVLKASPAGSAQLRATLPDF